MADQPVAEDKKPVDVAGASVEPNALETTTVNDGNLPINVSVPTALASTPVDTPAAVAPPETPILVTESEVLPAQANGSGLAEEVESLSGEIQALEAKIDRLTGSVKPVTSSPKVNLQVEKLTTDETAPPSNDKDEERSTEATETKPTAEPIPTPIPMVDTPVAVSNKSESKTVGINDIYNKVAQRQKEADAPAPSGSDEAEDINSTSSIGVIGEALAVFGVIIFLFMGAFPFYKSMMPGGIVEALRSIGWPTAVITLALGFLLSLFGGGKLTIKIFSAIILLFALILYLGVAGFQSYLGPIAPMLDSAFSFYR